MSHSIFGWDLPPGCSVSDIPGNRPEDARWESIIENFWDKRRKHKGLIVSTKSKRVIGQLFKKTYPKSPSKRVSNIQDAINEYIEMAIEYGMEIGHNEAQDNNKENKFYETKFIVETLQKENTPQATIDKIEKILRGELNK